MRHARHHLKHWLVAHRKNDHRPHLIRRHGLALTAAAIVAIQLVGYVSQTHAAPGHVLAYATDINTSELFTLTNQERADNGLPALHLDNRLNTSATLKANDMFANNYWAHVSPSGVQPWYWFGQAGYSYSYAGENLAKDFDTSSGVMDGWMNSPGHRANILNPNYTDIGFAVENGTLVGGQTTLVVQHFGTPAGVSVAANVVPATPRPTVKAVSAPVATATPVPTPVPTATPVPTLTPTPVKSVGDITQIAPGPATYHPIGVLAVSRSVNKSTLATILILLLLLVVYIQTHFIVWRKGLKRWRQLHYRLWASAQVSSLMIVVAVLAASGSGRVG